ncbi:TPA: hypothetical protein I9Z92_000476 [Clostridium perfringens]|nr:hypothetical protein [Clostridium perfringens]HAT4237511.1 hypothetical protein [Clostridium perfringens]
MAKGASYGINGRFILTMRNVNTTVVYQLSTPVTGFILTMRNVNYGNANTASQINAVLY